jgi:hypothetical protein
VSININAKSNWESKIMQPFDTVFNPAIQGTDATINAPKVQDVDTDPVKWIGRHVFPQENYLTTKIVALACSILMTVGLFIKAKSLGMILIGVGTIGLIYSIARFIVTSNRHYTITSSGQTINLPYDNWHEKKSGDIHKITVNYIPVSKEEGVIVNLENDKGIIDTSINIDFKMKKIVFIDVRNNIEKDGHYKIKFKNGTDKLIVDLKKNSWSTPFFIWQSVNLNM